MIPSLIWRIRLIGTLVAGVLVALMLLLLGSSIEMRNGYGWLSHSQSVIQTIDETILQLGEAESGQRGYLLTQRAEYAENVSDRLADVNASIARLDRLTADNPAQHRRAKTLKRALDDRIAAMREPLELANAGRFGDAREIVAGGKGRILMAIVENQASTLLESERDLLAQREAKAAQRLAWNKQLVMFGGPVILGMIIFMVIMITNGVRRPLEEISASMARIGTDGQASKVSTAMGSSEFGHLARGYNDMVGRLDVANESRRDSEAKLHTANSDLLQSSAVLKNRSEVIELLSGMAHRMQACRTDDELSDVVATFVPRVLPNMPGSLYAHNNSRNLLMQIARWGDAKADDPGFAPESCWALRRGQSHFVSAPGKDVICSHMEPGEVGYHCEPLLAGGEVVGMLHFESLVDEEDSFCLTALSENIASALVNHRLQRGLREQTIRDPLTGLFNRRYMNEAMGLEIARAAREKRPLSLVMCDVDHFKRFNDEFGHDAGDTVLKMVAAEMQQHVRDGDVVCRYGGEEFAIIAPGATTAALAKRIEHIRMAISKLNIRHEGQSLGAVSMSFGIAAWEGGLTRDATALVQVADAALYRAKREGRNRAVIADKQVA